MHLQREREMSPYSLIQNIEQRYREVLDIGDRLCIFFFWAKFHDLPGLDAPLVDKYNNIFEIMMNIYNSKVSCR